MRRTLRILRNYSGTFLALILFFGTWQLYVDFSGISPAVLPSPFRIVQALQNRWPEIWDNLLVTLLETLWGFGVALVLGFAFAAVLDNYPSLRKALYPLLVASQTIPLIAIAPLLFVWFGFDILPKIIIVWLVCFFPITVGAVDGFAGVDPDAARLFKAMGASKWQIFWKLRLPTALPGLFSGIRIAITYSVAGAILGEYVGAEKGLGRLISLYSRSFSRELVFAVVFVTAFLSLLLFAAVTVLQHRIMPWYFAMRVIKNK
jgi:ABC-type nitrate/sulfonate/bicarbonate transport system permease component